MKNNFKIAVMAIAAIATTGFISCNRGGDGPGPDVVRDATLKITLVNPTNNNSRVAGAASDTGTTVTDFSIFVIDDRGIVGWSEYVSGVGEDASKKTIYMDVTTAAKAIYAIANAGTDLHDVYTTKDALESANPLVTNLSSQYTSRWATGYEDGASWAFQGADSNSDGMLEQVVNLELDFIAARIQVTVNNRMANYDGTSTGKVNITNVAVLNARGQSRLFPGTGTSLIPDNYDTGKKYMEGIANNSFAYYPADGDYTVETAGTGQLNNAYTFTNSSTPTFAHFYVFETDADDLADYPTIVTLVGTDADGLPVYFPVHFSSYETWASNEDNYTGGITRGNSYNVTITLNGDATRGSGGGTNDPTKNVENVEIKATISIAPWIPIDLGKNF